jgi:hypothetical protein
MKNLILFLICFLSVVSLGAQTEKGVVAFNLHNFSPGGISGYSAILSHTNLLGFSFGKEKDKVGSETYESKYSEVGLNFNGHFFIIDNLSLGLAGTYFNQVTKVKDSAGKENKSSASILMAGPEVRYYIKTSAKTKAYLNGYALTGTYKYHLNNNANDDNPTNLRTFGGTAGVAYFPIERFSIDLGLGYNVFKTKDYVSTLGVRTQTESTFSGLTIDVGFGVYF